MTLFLVVHDRHTIPKVYEFYAQTRRRDTERGTLCKNTTPRATIVRTYNAATQRYRNISSLVRLNFNFPTNHT
jgi:hypothetical protein